MVGNNTQEVTQAVALREKVAQVLTNGLLMLKEKVHAEKTYSSIEKTVKTRIKALDDKRVCACDIIHLFGDVPFTGDAETDFWTVNDIYQTLKPYSAGQCIILGCK